MNIDEFLLKLFDDCDVKNLAFREDKHEFITSIISFKSKLAIALSSSFFNENIRLFSNMVDINNIQSIISLPIFKEYSNLIVVILNPNKKSDEFLLIDESDSLIHENEIHNISDELANNIINTIKNYDESDNAMFLNLSAVFKNNNIAEVVSDDYDEILDLYVDENIEGIKKKSMAEVVHDDILDLNEEELLVFDNAQEKFSEIDVDILELVGEDEKPIKRKVRLNNIVDGILRLKEEKFNQKEEVENVPIPLYEGMVEITSSNVLKELTYFKKRPDLENMLKKNNKRLIEGNVQFRNLGNIADLRNIDEKNSDNTILIATCKLCGSKLVYYNHDVTDFNGEIFVEISNVSDDVSDEYLYEYLNSENGLNELLYFSKGYNYIRADLIKSVKIPVPSLKIQKEIVKASKDAREFFNTVDLLKKEFNSNILDYKHISQSIKDLKGDIEIDSKTSEITKMSGSWRHAYQGLVWPLAISYLSATKGGFEIVEKKDNYLKLFEFTTAFNAIILLSGLPEEVYINNFDEIWTGRLEEYRSMTFGKWFVISKNLSEVYDNNNFTSKLDEQFFKKIKSNQLLDLLNESKNYRNTEFHEAMRNAYESEKTIEILDKYLENIFDILDVYSNYKFIYITGRMESHKQGFIHEVILLNGPCAQPIYDKIIFDVPLKGEALYLYNPKNNKKLLINDNFMKFRAIDKNKKHWALFIYNSCNKRENTAYYKCFQSKENDFKERISSLKEDVLL